MLRINKTVPRGALLQIAHHQQSCISVSQENGSPGERMRCEEVNRASCYFTQGYFPLSDDT